MKIKNKDLELLYKFFSKVEMPSQADLRVRDKFTKQLKENLTSYTEDSKKIYEQFAKKNEDGSPMVTQIETGFRYTFPEGVIDEVIKEVETLNNEEVEIDIDPKIPTFIEFTKYMPEDGEMLRIDAIFEENK